MPDDVWSSWEAKRQMLGAEGPGGSPVSADGPPFVALGHDRGRYFFSTSRGGQVLEFSARDLRNDGRLMELAPLLFWESTYPGAKGFDGKAAANALIAHCFAAGIYDPDRLRGRGAWLDHGRVVLHLGDRTLIDGLPSTPDGEFIYERSRRLDLALGEPLAAAEAARLMDLCMAVPWEDREGMGRLLAGWLVVAQVCGAMPWRPHLWLTSEAGSGKTWVLDNIVRPVLGTLALQVQSKTTEAGLRGELGIDARPVVFDEAETQNQRDRERMQLILDLARQASSEAGADILKGTQQGGVRRYRIRSCFAFSSVNVGLQQAADESRTVVLTIRPSGDKVERDEAFARLRQAHAEILTPDFGPRLLARTLRLLPVIRANAETFAAAVARQLGSRRLGDTLGVVMAGAWSLASDAAVTPAQADKFIATRGWVGAAAERSETEPEWRRALSYLAQHALRVVSSNGRPEDCPLGELLALASGAVGEAPTISVGDARRALLRAGLRLEDRDTVALATASDLLRRAFADTPWGASWSATIGRAPGATRDGKARRFGAGPPSKAVLVPLALLLGEEGGISEC